MSDAMLEEYTVEESQSGMRLDKFLTEIYPDQTRSFLQKLVKSGEIKVNGKPVIKAGFVVEGGDQVSASIPTPQAVEIEAENIPLDILYEDADVLIVNKPKGMVVHPSAGHYSGTLVNAIMYHCADSLSGINGEIRPGIVHRIDMDTTGALIICKNDAAHVDIAEQIKEHTVTRRYRGIVCGVVKEDEGTIEGAIGRHPTQRKKMAINEKNGKPAITHYKVLQRFAKYTYMEFLPGDGTHSSDPCAYGKHRPSASWGRTVWKSEKSCDEGIAGTDAACYGDRVCPSDHP